MATEDASIKILPVPSSLEAFQFTFRSTFCNDSVPNIIANMEAITQTLEWMYQEEEDGTWVLSDEFGAALRAMACAQPGFVEPCEEELGLSVSCVAGDGQVTVSLAGTQLKVGDDYQLFYAEVVGGVIGAWNLIPTGLGIWTAVANPTWTYVHTGLTNGKTYTYMLRAKHTECDYQEATSGNCTPTSNPVTCALALQPGAYVLDIPNQQVTLSWDGAAAGMSYILEVQTDSGWLLLASGLAVAGTITIAGLTWITDAATVYRITVDPGVAGCAAATDAVTVPSALKPSGCMHLVNGWIVVQLGPYAALRGAITKVEVTASCGPTVLEFTPGAGDQINYKEQQLMRLEDGYTYGGFHLFAKLTTEFGMVGDTEQFAIVGSNYNCPTT